MALETVVDPAQPTPIYFQLKTLLLEEILSGRYGADGRLPTEHELCGLYGVSRTPVTRALSELAQDGVILRHRRRGSFGRVRDAARILDLGELLDRKPARLSGGQRQRVAMGRAIVREPGLEQVVVLAPEARAPAQPLLRFRGRLDRPAFAEITEVSPLSPLNPATTLSAEGRALRVAAPSLPASVEIRVSAGAPVWEIAEDSARLALGNVELEVRITCSLE